MVARIISVASAIFAACSVLTSAEQQPPSCQQRKSFDFIVVGAGASGLTVADRLTEDPKVSVLVLEHGPFDQQEAAVTVPGLLNLSSTPYFFPLTTVPLRNLNNRVFNPPAGSGVGGSTLINGIFFDRGSHADYDAWGQLGNDGWSWSDLLPYFIKSETFSPPSAEYASKYGVTYDPKVHGKSGPVQSSFPKYQYGSVTNFLRAWKSLGIQSNLDPVAGSKAGVFLNPSSLDYLNQSRSYARSAHYDGVSAKRRNYCVLPEHTVTRVIVQNGRAVGVEYVSKSNSQTRLTAAATKEVIMAAGAYNTPKILQHSGIGSSVLLSKLGIKTVVDLPGVGHNLQDHPTFYTSWNFTNLPSPTPNDVDYNQTVRQAAIKEYYRSRTGPLTVVHYGGNVVAFLPLSQLSTDVKAINSAAQSTDANSIYPQSAPSSVIEGYKAQKKLLLSILNDDSDSVQETGYGGSQTIPVTMTRPFSRGVVLINSTDPLQQAMIDYGTFTAPVDMKILVAALRKNREMMRTSAMQQLGASEVSPGVAAQSDQELEAIIREQGQPTYSHGCCTAAMMPKNLGGVVDSTLSVYGVQGLRVVDASIMPIIPSSHTSATVYAVAEKAADYIKKDYHLS